MTDYALQSQASQSSARPAAAQSYLYHPIVDFLCLGGGSLLILFPILLWASEDIRPSLVVATFFGGYLLNQPHFAHSYQIFYRNFRSKLLSDEYPKFLRLKYTLSGIIVPVTMLVFFTICVITQNSKLLGMAGNVLALTVGWHYVKQGYGILMVECVLKRCFFTDREKNRLKLNAYVIWMFSWVYANVAFNESRLWELTVYSFDIPPWLLGATGLLALGSTLLIVVTVIGKAITNHGRLPYNGLLAYAASVYVWIYAIYSDPLLVFVVPAFHSIQYLAVVWRYQLNKERAELGPNAAPVRLLGGRFELPRHFARLARFIIIGAILGAVGFHAAPYLLTASVTDSSGQLGPSMFFMMFWIFFNVHHYFLDNVMWRKENPDIKKHLFTPV